MRRTPLARVSAKRKDEAHEYDRARTIAFLRDKGVCQAARIWLEVECSGRLDPHHIHPVGRYPELRCDPDNLVTLCRAHHSAAHDADPVRARELGLLA